MFPSSLCSLSNMFHEKPAGKLCEFSFSMTCEKCWLTLQGEIRILICHRKSQCTWPRKMCTVFIISWTPFAMNVVKIRCSFQEFVSSWTSHCPMLVSRVDRKYLAVHFSFILSSYCFNIRAIMTQWKDGVWLKFRSRSVFMFYW